MKPLHGERVASIDVGSNSALLLIAERRDGAWIRVEEQAEVTRISEGMDRSGYLADVPVARTAEVLARFAERVRTLGSSSAVATGTAPFRRARNGAEVARKLSSVLGFELEVVSGEDEAALSFEATRVSFPELVGLRVVDPGGASTELITAPSGVPVESVSVDLGSVRLHERFLAHEDPPSAGAVDALRGCVRDALQAAPLEAFRAHCGLPLVGLAGTVTTLASVAQALEVWDPDRIQGYALARETLSKLTSTLLTLSHADRRALPGMDPRRADVLPAGALLMEAILEAAGATELRVSDRGVRWGRLAHWCLEGPS